MHEIERHLTLSNADFFDEAETNLTGKTARVNDITFPDNLDSIKEHLKELRLHTIEEDIILPKLKMSALNVYIENALQLSKRMNLVDMRSIDRIDTPLNGEQHSSQEERQLKLQGSLKNIGIRFDYGKKELVKPQSISGKLVREQGLLDLAKEGQLFKIDLDSVYDSVGSTQVSNFQKIYGIGAN